MISAADRSVTNYLYNEQNRSNASSFASGRSLSMMRRRTPAAVGSISSSASSSIGSWALAVMEMAGLAGPRRALGTAGRAIVPQDDREHGQVVLDRVRPALEPRLRADDRQALLVAAIGEGEALALEPAADLRDRFEDRAVELHRGHGFASGVNLVQGDPRGQDRRTIVGHHLEQVAVLGDVLDPVAEEEPVVQGRQRLLLRKFGGGPHHGLQRALDHFAVVVE